MPAAVMPPIARLTPEQAIYHFISGYTSKIAGTEIGMGAEPEITFSTCFGGPFMVHHPLAYAEMLKARLLRSTALTCWLVNTGWTGGPFGVGKRISIRHTRALLNAALTGTLLKVEYKRTRYLDSMFRRMRGRAFADSRSGQYLAKPGGVFQKVRRARSSLYRKFQADGGGTSRAHIGGWA